MRRHDPRSDTADRTQEPRTPSLRSKDIPLPDRRSISLSVEELETMRTIGAFRMVNKEDLSGAKLGRLRAAELLDVRTVYPRRGERLDVVFLTKQGRNVLTNMQPMEHGQRYYSGFVKPNEIAHDAAIYPAAMKERQTIERAGGKVRRVVLDYELKSQINARMNALDGPTRQKRRDELAKEYDLPIVNGKLSLPDVRIEYVDAEGREMHCDVEVVTRHYRGSHMAGKAASGFKLVDQNVSRAPVRDDHHVDWL